MPFAFAANNNLAGSPVDVIDLDRDDFRRSKPKTGDQEHHGVVSPARIGVGANGLDERVHLLGCQMPGQPCTVSLSHAWNAQGEVGCCFPGLEEVSEEVPQMGGERLVTQRRLSRRHRFKEGCDVGRRDFGKLADFLLKAECEEAVGDAPAMEYCPFAKAALAAQIFFVFTFESSARCIVKRRAEWRFGGPVSVEELDETFDDELVVFAAVRLLVRFRDQFGGLLPVEIFQIDVECRHLIAESVDALAVLCPGLRTVVQILQMLLKLLWKGAKRIADRRRVAGCR